MLAKPDLRKPGARMHIESIYKAHERARGNSERHWDTSYTLHHAWAKERMNDGQIEHHPKSRACLKDCASLYFS
jgi:hypothetical protein